MTATAATLRWSEKSPPEDVSDPEALITRLHDIAAQCELDMPLIVSIYLHAHEVSLGLGLRESFVQIEPDLGEPPYVLTVGDSTAHREVAFYLHGAHHTESPRRNLISAPEALNVVREFLETGERSERIAWEEV